MSSRGTRFVVLTVVLVAAVSGIVLAIPGTGAGAPGDALEASGRLVSLDRQNVWDFTLHAEEHEPGKGGMGFLLSGPGIGVCDAHGGDTSPGSTPLAEFECFGSSNVKVQIAGCTATLQTHGVVHADHPYTVFMGPVTLDIVFERLNAQRSSLRVDIYTPKEPIVLEGRTIGPVNMSSCP